VYRWIEHTGELELELEADAERGVFEAGFDAMRELLAGDAEGDERAVRREIALAGVDRAVMLADWLAELAYLAETEGLVPRWLAAFNLTEAGLEALVEGSEGEPPHLVKAVTYHRLALRRVGDRWHATVILDV
jgi:SHS2 domain-containing protein